MTMKSQHPLGVACVLSLCVWPLAVSAAQADRQITLELELFGAAPPSHLCVVSEHVAGVDAWGDRLPENGQRMEFRDAEAGKKLTPIAATDPPPLQDGESCAVAADTVQPAAHSAWRSGKDDPCEATFESLPNENMRCAINKSAGAGSPIGIAVVRVTGRRLDDLELVGKTATFQVSDRESNKAQSLTVEVIGAHYRAASGATSSTGTGREFVALPLVRKCSRVAVPTLPNPCGASSVALTAGTSRACRTQTKAGQIELPFLLPGENVRATLCGITYEAQYDDSPAATLAFAPTTVRFSWARDCLVPQGLCPRIDLPQVAGTCESCRRALPPEKGQDPRVCRYEWRSQPAGTPITLPTQVRFQLLLPDSPGEKKSGTNAEKVYETWNDELRYVGQELDSFLPASERWLELHWPVDIRQRSTRKRDAITHVEVSDATGKVYSIATETERINVPGLRCRDSFRYRYIGDRAFHPQPVTLEDYQQSLTFHDPDADVIKRATLALELGGGNGALAGADDFRQPTVAEAAVALVYRLAPRLDMDLARFSATYAAQPFLSRLNIQNGSLAHEDLPVTVPYMHYALGTALSYSLSNEFYFGAGFGGALGTKVLQRDADRARVKVELAARTFLGFRLTRAIAIQASAQGLFFGKWIRSEQTQQGLQRVSQADLQLLYWSVGLRFDDLI
jgi:hypothetical protein